MASKPSQSLDTFPNPQPGRDYTIRMRIPDAEALYEHVVVGMPVQISY